MRRHAHVRSGGHPDKEDTGAKRPGDALRSRIVESTSKHQETIGSEPMASGHAAFRLIPPTAKAVVLCLLRQLAQNGSYYYVNCVV